MEIILATLRGATPLLFASLGGLFSERSGIVQIALEGMMLMGALAAAIVTLNTGSPYIGMCAGAVAGMLLAGLYAFFAITLRSNQIVAGTAANLFALGIAPFITKIVFDSTGSTPNLPLESRFTVFPFILAAAVSLFMVFWYGRTRSSVKMIFAGEAPEVLQASGTRVDFVRWMSVLMCGLMAGTGGATLSTFLASSYAPNMTAGRGFIALAALIFGGWKPLPTIFACIFFAFIDAVQIRLQGTATRVPVQFIQILPYLITMIALSGFFNRARAPKGLGQHVE